MICAGGYSGEVPQTCRGDSGGPLVCMKDNELYLAGVTSWVSYNCKVKNYPSGFARVSTYLPWIQSLLEPPPPPKCEAFPRYKSWYRDGFCDKALNNPECGYDGGDCCVSKRDNWDYYCGSNCDCLGMDCPPHETLQWMGDNYCDSRWNNPGCFYDYGDCCENKVEEWDKYCQNKPELCRCLDPNPEN